MCESVIFFLVVTSTIATRAPRTTVTFLSLWSGVVSASQRPSNIRRQLLSVFDAAIAVCSPFAAAYATFSKTELVLGWQSSPTTIRDNKI